MSRIALVTDSTSDLDDEMRLRLSVTVVPLNVHFGDETLRDYVDISPDTFLKRLAKSSTMPRTSQPSPAQFTEVFDHALAEYEHVLVITLSASLSGTWQSAVLGAASSIAPNRITIIDSRSASVGLQMQVARARNMIDQGTDITTIAERLEAERDMYRLVFFADTLDYLQRGGRIGKAGHLIGSLLKIKPLLACENGEVVPFERTRTRSKAIAGLIAFAEARPSIVAMTILHDGTEDDDVALIRAAMVGRIGPNEIADSRYGPIVATHVGPGALGICIFEGASGV